MRGSPNSIYAIMNSLIPIEDNLQRSVPLKQMEKALQIFRSLNPDLRERQVQLILDELRGLRTVEMQAYKALNWLTIRICIMVEMGKPHNSDSKKNKSTGTRHSAEKLSHSQMLQTSLLWHCASLKNFNQEHFVEVFDDLKSEHFLNHQNGLTLEELRFLVKEFLHTLFPHSPSTLVARVTSTFLAIVDVGTKELYSWQDLDQFPMNFMSVILWETQKTIKNLFKIIWETIGGDKDNDRNEEDNPEKMKDYLNKLNRIQKLNAEKRAKKSSLHKSEGLLQKIFGMALGVMMRGSLKPQKTIGDADDEYRNRMGDVDDLSLSDEVTPMTKVKPTTNMQSALHAEIGSGFRLTVGAPKPSLQQVPALHLNPDAIPISHVTREPEPSKMSTISPIPVRENISVSVFDGVRPSEHESVMVNPYWKVDKGKFDTQMPPFDVKQEPVTPKPQVWMESDNNLDAFRPQINQQSSMSQYRREAGKESNIGNTLRVDTYRDPTDNRREMGEGRDLLEKDECTLI